MKKNYFSLFLTLPLFANATVTMEAKYNTPKINLSDEAEFDIYTNNIIGDKDFEHFYASIFGLNVDVQFNEKWFASVALHNIFLTL